MSTPAPLVRPAADWKPYTQPEPGLAEFWKVFEKTEVPHFALGKVRLTGPIHKTPAAHGENEQVYLVQSGQGTIHIAGQAYAINGPTAVHIPRNTTHSVEVPAGAILEYFYINQYAIT